MSLPQWLERTDNTALPAGSFRRGRADYLERTLNDIQKAMAADIDQTTTAARPGFLQGLNPQVKLAGIGLVLAAVALTGSLPALVAVHGLLFATAVLSDIGWKGYLTRVWLPASLFAGVAVLPGVFSWITPGQPLWLIYQGADWHLGPIALPAELAVTRQGLTAAGFVLLRSAASLGLVVLLVKTTRWPVLTKALGRLGLPGLFVMVLDLTYRYLFLFLLLLSDYLWGRRSRLVGAVGTGAKLAWIGGAIAGFLRMAGEYCKEISAAMQARGYDGGVYHVSASRVGPADVSFLAAAALVVALMLGGVQLVRIFGV